MAAKRSYKQYPQELKEETVALVIEQGYSVPEATISLSVETNLLYHWKDKQEQFNDKLSLADTEQEELKRLRQEVKTLRMEKEVLKKPALSLRKK